LKQKIRPIAIYLPQFHPVKENDEWWGTGFTEWTNVTKAKPLYKGHYQPHLPADLGFYDLRLPESREAQAKLAEEYGIYGFCYYHYWFNGRRILERPFQEVFESGNPDFPFMLCWANENWTRIWDGGSKNILLEQKYSLEDDLNHIRALIPYFKDPRYIRIDNKPVFAVYRSTLFPDMKKTIEVWRAEAARHGLELYLTRFESFGVGGKEYMEAGFDAAIEFPPHGKEKVVKSIRQEVSLEAIINTSKNKWTQLKRKLMPGKAHGYFHDYKELVDRELARLNEGRDYKFFPGVTPGWDNSARKKDGFVIYKNASPELFEKWLAAKVNAFTPYSEEENLFFINAWNEWAEGNHLEPCRKWGKKYLEIVKKVFTGT
jgi:lipopolysaccharide biosynthesis protein